MAHSYFFLLLKLVSKNSDVSFLLKQGLSYSQISRLVGQAIEEALIDSADGQLLLTQKGEEYIQKASGSTNLGSPSTWIAMDERYRIPMLDKSEIFLPTKKEIDF